jgi:DNA-binding PadR family transcriptional regulator
VERYVSRLLVLGMLSRTPMHGHRLKREAELRDVNEWAGISVGSLYGMMHRLEQEGLIRPLRVEREGQRPARTVYALTDEGRKELGILLDAAFQKIDYELGAFDVALLVADATLSYGELAEQIELRVERTTALLHSLVSDRRNLEEKGQGGTMERLIMIHAEHKLETELRWYQEVIDTLRSAQPPIRAAE